MTMIDRGEFLFKGYQINIPVRLSFKDYEISLTTNLQNVENHNKLMEELTLASETSTLTIKGIGDQEKLRDVAVDIKNLLSIAIGKSVTFDRQIYWVGQSKNQIEKVMSKNENKGEQIIPDFEISKYLTAALSIWGELSKDQKTDYFTIIDYLNQTRHGFIEDRILRTVQAWECSAFYWTQESKLPPELNDLKTRIKEAYREWQVNNSYKDFDGELGKRLTSALEQEKLMIRLEKLVSDSRLNTSKIKLDRSSCSHWTN